MSSLIKILSFTEAGSVKEIKIGNEIVKGTEFRTLFNLNSTNFTLDFQQDSVEVNCKGYGHGVGMSQWGLMRWQRVDRSMMKFLNITIAESKSKK